MEFTFDTVYNARVTRAMARALRKTMRRKKSIRSRIFGWCVVMFSLPLLFRTQDGHIGFDLQPRTILTLLVLLVLFCVLIFEDHLNGSLARKRLPPGVVKSHTVFRETEFVSETALGATTFSYDKILLCVEDAGHFILIYGQNHAQVYAKKGLSGATEEEFRAFLEKTTGSPVRRI